MSSLSSIIESQILHTTTTRTLHAHNFNKSSTRATHVLTDILSRYLALLATTCAHYAEHAGRTGVTVCDVLAALEEIGVGIDELREYVEGEARDMVRYTSQTARRAEEFAEVLCRTTTWKAPEHIPDFLPPFPGHSESSQSSPSHDPAMLHPEPAPLQLESEGSPAGAPMSVSPAPITPTRIKLDPNTESQRPTQLNFRQPSPALPTPSNTSSYLISIPYEHSSLASAPEWHLPKPLPDTSPPVPTSTLPALISSHSYLQSSSLSAPSLQPPNPLRHGLAMVLLGISARAYSPAATLFGSSTTNACTPIPRRAAPLAAHAIPLDKNGKASFNIAQPKGTLPVPPAELHARSAAGPVPIVDSTSVQGSRIPALARSMLSLPVIARTTRLVPPPPLERNDQKLLYGPPVPAPWNTTLATNLGEGKALRGGKDKDEDEEEAEDKVLADAHLFATWDYDPKDFRAGLPMAKRGSKVGMGLGGANGTVLSTKRKRSDSTVPLRRGYEVGSGMTRIKTER